MDAKKKGRLVRMYGVLDAVTREGIDEGLDNVGPQVRRQLEASVPKKLRKELDEVVPAKTRWDRATVAALKGWLGGVLHELEAGDAESQAAEAAHMMAALAAQMGVAPGGAPEESGEDARRHIGYV